MKPGASARARLRTVAVVPAAGCGRRLGTALKKPFVLLAGKPIIVHTLKALEACEAVDAIVVASEETCVKRFKDLVKRYRLSKVSRIVVGGPTRFESVKNCLAAIEPSFDIVVVHDGARPLIDAATIAQSVKLAGKFGACVVGVPESDTVKFVDGALFVKGTLDRNRIYRAQTPQAFRRDIINRAYAIKGKASITDDAGAVENLGCRIKLLIGPNRNIKITTKEDVRLAETLL